MLLAVIATTTLQSCKDDAFLLNPPPSPNVSFTEEFDTASAVLAKGWKFINTTFPRGGNVWQDGGDVLNPFFNAFSQRGSYAGFIGASFASTTADQGMISNWLVSPSMLIKNGDKIIFYTRAQVLPGTVAGDTTDYGNRLQVRINSTGDELNMGSMQSLYESTITPFPDGADNPGAFDISLLDINPFQIEWHKLPGVSAFDNRPYNATTNLSAYPVRWTRFEVTVRSLNRPLKSRFAFRYYVEKGGNNGFATGVGIDKLEYISAAN